MYSRPTTIARRFTVGIAALLAVACGCRPVEAQQAAKADGAAADHGPAKADAAELPLSRVVLFTSGVGFYEHAGEVEGNRQVELRFNTSDVNDLLKSMVLRDLGGGKVSTVTYNSRDPITKTLKTFAIDLTTKPTLAALLDQVRGERVELEVSGADPVQGTILGTETRRQKVEAEVVEVEYLNLLGDRGLRSIQLASVASVRLLNPALDQELRQALAVLALGHSTDKKGVTLNFTGQGKRPVRVGYIQQSPLWKTTYRLVLSDDKAPYLQGWALVENTTDNDWKDVSLTLVSGRPISFMMNLYEPLYVPRPTVEPELFASLRPQRYGQDLAKADAAFAARAEKGAARQLAAAPAAPPAAMAANGQAVMRRAAGEAQAAAVDKLAERGELDLQRGVASAAQAGELGELFQYAIDTPVTLPRQQSAMLPIVQGDVQGQKVSIYNAAVHVKHPLNGLRLKNTSGLHLMQGPITVFDDGAYAGDAQIDDIAPGAERLLSYAIDLNTEVSTEWTGTADQLVSLKLYKGMVIISRRIERSRTFTVKNSGGKTRQVLIEVPLDAGWNLVAPKEANEKTRDRYRFNVAAESGKPARLAISEEQVLREDILATNLNDQQVAFYTSAKVVSDNVKSKLAELMERKRSIANVQSQLDQVNQELATITQEQSRIRENMKTLDRQNELYLRYVKIFGAQEDRVANLREQAARLTSEIKQLQKSFDDFLKGLDVA